MVVVVVVLTVAVTVVRGMMDLGDYYGGRAQDSKNILTLSDVA